MDTLEKVKGIVAEQLGIDASEITLESSFEGDLKADSLDRVELIMSLEEAFSLEISDDEAAKIETVRDVVVYVDRHRVAV